VIVVNTTFRLAPWADALYALDEKWWEVHGAEAAAEFSGDRMSATGVAGVRRVPITRFGNSGADAIAAAVFYGARRVVLLGYDCQKTNGMTHWHGSHPSPLGDAGSMPKWPAKFRRLALVMRKAEILNCSRETALTVFPRANLEDALK